MKIKNQKSKIKNQFRIFSPKLLSSQASKLVRGFTLIETLVAITLLVIAITGPLQIASNALNSAFYARDEITSYYLAVEAIEYIKNSRESLFLSDVFTGVGSASPWLFGLDHCISDGTGAGCYMKTTSNFDSVPDSEDSASILACEETCPKLEYDSSSGFWGYDLVGGDIEETKFTRKTEIILIGDNSAIVKVRVSWPSRSLLGADKTFELSTMITNWERI